MRVFFLVLFDFFRAKSSLLMTFIVDTFLDSMENQFLHGGLNLEAYGMYSCQRLNPDWPVSPASAPL